MQVALIYGSALVLLFSVSFLYHCVFYSNRNQFMKDLLHRMDRAMIYIFIAGSYYPWLILEHSEYTSIVTVLKWLVWILAALGILYQQIFHERYKSIETIFYMLIGIVPALIVVLCGHEFIAMSELKLGGVIYVIGVIFFKSDGRLCCAHCIWHTFVGLAAYVHYFAILKYLYSEQSVHEHLSRWKHLKT
jgi:monocyte to macrophage differentiation protein